MHGRRFRADHAVAFTVADGFVRASVLYPNVATHAHTFSLPAAHGDGYADTDRTPHRYTGTDFDANAHAYGAADTDADPDAQSHTDT